MWERPLHKAGPLLVPFFLLRNDESMIVNVCQCVCAPNICKVNRRTLIIQKDQELEPCRFPRTAPMEVAMSICQIRPWCGPQIWQMHGFWTCEFVRFFTTFWCPYRPYPNPPIWQCYFNTNAFSLGALFNKYSLQTLNTLESWNLYFQHPKGAGPCWTQTGIFRYFLPCFQVFPSSSFKEDSCVVRENRKKGSSRKLTYPTWQKGK